MLSKQWLEPMGRERLALGVAAVGFALSVLAFYPGFMSRDSFSQYQQGLEFKFSDWHPPIMALLWSILNVLWTGPQPMLILQNLLYWGGVWYFLRAIKIPSRIVRYAILGLLFSPAIMNFTGVIWKDVQLAAAWSFVIGCAFAHFASGRQMALGLKTALLALLCYGGLVRLNAALVAGPLVIYVLSGRPWLSSSWRTIGGYAIITVIMFGLAQAVNVSGIPSFRLTEL